MKKTKIMDQSRMLADVRELLKVIDTYVSEYNINKMRCIKVRPKDAGELLKAANKVRAHVV